MMTEGICLCIHTVKNTDITKNKKYNFHLMPGYNTKEGHKKKKYYRVFPDNSCYTYYEIFKPDEFEKYFKVLTTRSTL